MPEDQKISLIVPPEVGRAQAGTHSAYRYTTVGKILNLGPSQPYKNPVTQEVANQPYKYANPTQTPWDMNLNYIPGMHPFQWDLASLVVTFAAPLLGVAEGAMDDSDAKDIIREINNRHPTPSVKDILEVADELNKKPTSTGNGSGTASRLGGAPSNWFKKILSVNGKGYRIKVGGPDGKLNLDENVYESGDVSIYERLMNAKDTRWIKFEALGKNGKLDLFDGSHYQS